MAFRHRNATSCRAIRPSHTLSSVTKAEKVAKLRILMSRYRGGRFEASGSGGAGGMVFFIDRDGREYYMGGFKPGDAETLVRVLNLVIELLGAYHMRSQHELTLSPRTPGNHVERPRRRGKVTISRRRFSHRT